MRQLRESLREGERARERAREKERTRCGTSGVRIPTRAALVAVAVAALFEARSAMPGGKARVCAREFACLPSRPPAARRRSSPSTNGRCRIANLRRAFQSTRRRCCCPRRRHRRRCRYCRRPRPIGRVRAFAAICAAPPPRRRTTTTVPAGYRSGERDAAGAAQRAFVCVRVAARARRRVSRPCTRFGYELKERRVARRVPTTPIAVAVRRAGLAVPPLAPALSLSARRALCGYGVCGGGRSQWLLLDDVACRVCARVRCRSYLRSCCCC